MKKIFGIGILFICVITLSGCFKRDEYEGIKVYTTTYALEYLTKELYGNNAEILSIYPSGADYYNYSLSDKQINEYSKAGIFIYNGLSEEKNIARSFLNENHNLKIIDASYGLTTTYGMEELWLSPNNLLMLASTIKNNLKELITNKYMQEEIENNYSVLEETLSILDVELRTITKEAINNGYNTLIVASDSLAFLEEYGFKIININNDNNINDKLKANFDSEKYNYIFILNNQEVSEEINDLIDNHSATLIQVDPLLILDDKQINNSSNYQTIMKEFLENIKKVYTTKSD